MAKILAANKEYCGVSASVTFVNGVGETNDPHLISWFEKHGYTVDGGQKPEKKLEKMNKAELLEVAKEKGIEVKEEATNAEIVELIKAGE